MERLAVARKLASGMFYDVNSTTKRFLVICVGGKNGLLGARLAQIRDECNGAPKPQRLAKLIRELGKYKNVSP